MEHMHLFCPAHHHISDPGYDKRSNMMFHTVFDYRVAVMTVNTGKEHSLHPVQLIQISYAFGSPAVADDLEFPG